MAVDWVEVSVRARATGRAVGDEVLSVLGVRAEDGLRLQIGGPGQPTRIFLVIEDLASHAGAPDPRTAFAEAVERELLAAAEWLRRLPDGAFDTLRDRGVTCDVFVGSQTGDDRLEVSLPPRFLVECGYCGLPVTFAAND